MKRPVPVKETFTFPANAPLSKRIAYIGDQLRRTGELLAVPGYDVKSKKVGPAREYGGQISLTYEFRRVLRVVS